MQTINNGAWTTARSITVVRVTGPRRQRWQLAFAQSRYAQQCLCRTGPLYPELGKGDAHFTD